MRTLELTLCVMIMVLTLVIGRQLMTSACYATAPMEVVTAK